MGSFPGHALPGAFFICFALWWTIQIYRRYQNKKHGEGKNRFTSSVTLELSYRCRCLDPVPLEALTKVLFAVVGCIAEVSWSLHFDHHVPVGNLQHVTMFAVFGLSGIVDIIVQLKGKELPPNVDYLVFFIAIVTEGILFKFHLHGRSRLDVTLHTLLLYTISLNAIVVLLEMVFKHNVTIAFCRAYLFFLQGSWFWQIGFILYPPNLKTSAWKSDDMDDVMFAVLCFVLHAIINFFIMCLVCYIYSCLKRQCGKSSKLYTPLRIAELSKSLLMSESYNETEHMCDEVNSI